MLAFFFSPPGCCLVLPAAPLLILALAANVSASTLSVGPGKQFATPCAAFQSAADGDTVEIDAATAYAGDVCAFYKNHLTIRGVDGRPRINAGGRNASEKGIWVVGGIGTIIENVDMSGARSPNRNGAAIRLDGSHLTVRGSHFHDNENGILTRNNAASNIVIENCEFASNGAGDGYSHNVYIGHVKSLVFKGNYSHDAHRGYNLKSRANVNTILYNRFSSSTGQPAHEIDLPAAGTAYVIGNVIQQPADHYNSTLISYGREGVGNSADDLYVVNNTFLNNDSSSGSFIQISDAVKTPAVVQNNLFIGTGIAVTQVNAIDRSNYKSLVAPVVDRANYDLHPLADSAVVKAGSSAGLSASGVDLNPAFQYKHIAGIEPRPVNGALSIGAYEPPAVPMAAALPAVEIQHIVTIAETPAEVPTAAPASTFVITSARTVAPTSVVQPAASTTANSWNRFAGWLACLFLTEACK